MVGVFLKFYKKGRRVFGASESATAEGGKMEGLFNFPAAAGAEDVFFLKVCAAGLAGLAELCPAACAEQMQLAL